MPRTISGHFARYLVLSCKCTWIYIIHIQVVPFKVWRAQDKRACFSSGIFFLSAQQITQTVILGNLRGGGYSNKFWYVCLRSWNLTKSGGVELGLKMSFSPDGSGVFGAEKGLEMADRRSENMAQKGSWGRHTLVLPSSVSAHPEGIYWEMTVPAMILQEGLRTGRVGLRVSLKNKTKQTNKKKCFQGGGVCVWGCVYVSVGVVGVWGQGVGGGDGVCGCGPVDASLWRVWVCGVLVCGCHWMQGVCRGWGWRRVCGLGVGNFWTNGMIYRAMLMLGAHYNHEFAEFNLDEKWTECVLEKQTNKQKRFTNVCLCVEHPEAIFLLDAMISVLLLCFLFIW